ncbi:short chain dehydrogenase [Nocardioides baekrokdamisoli]|uniref:Short chain dehydrogenase n=1 Tax=Nocardioides baekrokdamisoli TaxID=1804624 RepID=A0A3G9IIX0_9ACTN|nr:NAD(P)-dependent oxidoreductase [Nocardioides baekrokdamisoli]BBH16005.1 short chain dehydrogenase [Nocardioides baekrokdamisoli]
MTSLANRTILMSGGSRGIGLSIALAAAREGANLVLLAKTDVPDPRLPGTIHTAVAEIEAAGGQALAVVGDVRDEESTLRAAELAAERFGGIDVVINNASAIDLNKTENVSVKKFDLMQQIQCRGTFLLTQAALPHLRASTNAHIVSLSPPLNMNPYWLGAHPAYTLAKYGMTLLTLSFAEEFRAEGIAGYTLWPETMIATAAVQNILGGEEGMRRARTPEIMADSAIELLRKPSAEVTGRSYLDVDVLSGAGVTDLSKYGSGDDIITDIFVDLPNAVRE